MGHVPARRAPPAHLHHRLTTSVPVARLGDHVVASRHSRWPPWASQYPHNGASLYRTRSKLAVVIGDDDIAEVLCRLFPCQGWRLRPTAMPGTPVTALHPVLGNRIFNALAREGFTTVEEVAAVPDTALMDIRGMGLGSINTVRNAIAATQTPSYPNDDAAVTLSGRQLRELVLLLATLTVYAKARSQTDIADRAYAFVASVVYRP